VRFFPNKRIHVSIQFCLIGDLMSSKLDGESRLEKKH
jgi:hypothetical protein